MTGKGGKVGRMGGARVGQVSTECVGKKTKKKKEKHGVDDHTLFFPKVKGG